MLKMNNIDFNILCTLTNKMANNPKIVWENIKKFDLKYIQFTPCLDSMNFSKSNDENFALLPYMFSYFLNIGIKILKMIYIIVLNCLMI